MEKAVLDVVKEIGKQLWRRAENKFNDALVAAMWRSHRVDTLSYLVEHGSGETVNALLMAVSFLRGSVAIHYCGMA